MKCTERLYLTADRQRVVRDGDTRAASLYAVPGDEIPASAVELFGLVDGGLPPKPKDLPKETAAKPAAPAKVAKVAKAAEGGATKEKAPAENKEAAPGGDKSGEQEPAKEGAEAQ